MFQNVIQDVIRGAILTGTEMAKHPKLFGLCTRINDIINNNTHIECINIPIPGTNYFIIKFKHTGPVIGYTVTNFNGYIENHDIGTIISNGFERGDDPNPAKLVVVQHYLCIYNTYNLRSILSDLIGATSQCTDPCKFMHKVINILNSIGYVSSHRSNPFDMIVSTDLSSHTYVDHMSKSIELMNQLKTLFDQKEVEHATEHMKQIFEIMSQFEYAVMQI